MLLMCSNLSARATRGRESTTSFNSRQANESASFGPVLRSYLKTVRLKWEPTKTYLRA